ncbi:MAG: haloacid dehalogenase superfamily enzyme subfamily [Phycisphaerales bacterium]|nr:haloacid dehalogenase superfamily enzyme subfamily [Phycisphaerales bacterium]
MRKLGPLRHLALDLDGTLYLGGRLFPCTVPFLNNIRELGIGRTFFTNNSSVSTRGYVDKLQALGIDAEAGEIYSSTTATLAHLKAQVPAPATLFVLGTPALRQEFADHGFRVCGHPGGGTDADGEVPDAVVVGFDPSLDYPRLCRAAYWISRGKPYVATNGDLVCPTDLPTVLPDCGSVCRLLAAATGREPDAVLGKPAPAMLGGVMRRHGLRPEEVAVVGDRLYTDIAMARAAGVVGVLVLTGEATRDQAASASIRPDLIVEDVGELAQLLAESRKGTL